ncbi:MAG: hypothetical protein HY831_00800 [Candidatus Aenigmarchaeota archaeon]|nr:hypothetical protein [Candidatus Aenigmarchaeota archaeon]
MKEFQGRAGVLDRPADKPAPGSATVGGYTLSQVLSDLTYGVAAQYKQKGGE